MKQLVLGARDDFLGHAHVTVKNFLLTLCSQIRFLKWLAVFLIFPNYCASPAATDRQSQDMFYICSLNSQLSISH